MSRLLPLREQFREDLALFAEEVARFRRGEITVDRFRSPAAGRGVYQEREPSRYMLRVRLPAGVWSPAAMRAVTEVARRFGGGPVHLTTRQDVQVHGVALENIHGALETLATADLFGCGGGGNTVRNLTGCSDAGVCIKEIFDVTPYVLAVTEFLLASSRSYQLPRKFKIAFSGCGADCTAAMVHDVGFVARCRNGVPGFAVYAGGGLGAKPRVGELLEEFIVAREAHLVAEAVKRVFDAHGDRENRQKARLRFLVERIGFAAFRDLYRQELTSLRQSGPGPLLPEFPLVRPVRPVGRPDTASAGFDAWRRRNVVPQKQAGYVLVHVRPALGDLDAATLEQLAGVVEEHGDRTARVTSEQGLVLRWLHQEDLPMIHTRLAALGLAENGPGTLAHLVSCLGASTCRLGICPSRDLAAATREALGRSDLDLSAFDALTIYVSGCPNTCGRHPLADIGLYGVARRVDGETAPHYVLQLGGRTGEGRTRLAEGDRVISAGNVPSLVVELLRAYRDHTKELPFDEFLRVRRDRVESLVAKHQGK